MTWKLHARRYDEPDPELGPGIDLRDLEKLIALRKALVGFAEDIWRKDNPGKRLPNHFEEHIDLRFFRPKVGSCQIEVVRPVNTDDIRQLSLLTQKAEIAVAPQDIGSKLPEAADRLAVTLNSIQEGKKPPFDIKPERLDSVKKISGTLGPGEKVGIDVAPSLDYEPVRRLDPTIARPALIEETSKKAVSETVASIKIDIKAQRPEIVRELSFGGHVTRADIGGDALIEYDGKKIPIKFTRDQEKDVTGALHRRESTYLEITGIVVLGQEDERPVAVREVKSLRCVEAPRLPSATAQVEIEWPDAPGLSNSPIKNDLAEARRILVDILIARHSMLADSSEGEVTDQAELRAEPSAAATCVRTQLGDLGDTPWVEIATVLEQDLAGNFSFGDIVAFASLYGFDWRDVHVVVDTLTDSEFIERLFLLADNMPPVPVPDEEVARRLRARARNVDVDGVTWDEWARRVKVVWRWTYHGSERGDS